MHSSNSSSSSAALHTIPALLLDRAYDKQLAKTLYPVSQALAAQVVKSCKVVTIWREHLPDLRDSPRWAGVPITAFVVLELTSTEEVPRGQHGLCVYIPSSSVHVSEDGQPLATGCWERAAEQLLAQAKQLPSLQVLVWAMIPPRAVSQQLAEAVSCWPELQRLELSRTGLGPEGALQLAAAAQHCRQLRHLDLFCNILCPLGAQHLLGSARYWPQLQHLGLGHNWSGDKGVQALAAAAPHWPQLQHLDLSGSELGPGDAEALAAAVVPWPQLQVLDVRGNEFGAEASEVLEAALKAAAPGCELPSGY